METVQYRYVPFAKQFVYNGITYIKTNHKRGYYFENGSKVFKNFKKNTLIQLDKKYIELPN